jgi:hypothetical protein
MVPKQSATYEILRTKVYRHLCTGIYASEACNEYGAMAVFSLWCMLV